jgi:hypothetical protein
VGTPPPSEIAESAALAYGVSPWPEADVMAFVRSLLRAEIVSRWSAASLIEAMLPREEVPSPTAVLQARRNAEARNQLLREFGGLTSGEVAEHAGSRAKNRAALANRWKQEGRIFSVPHQGAEIFPGLQFDEHGQPREKVREVVAALSAWSPWELALWFIAANGWLDGRRPVDLLGTDSEAVVRAARHAAAGIIF